MRDIKVASRYAKSLLKIAIEENSLEDLHKDMLLVNDVCSNNKELVLLLKSPIVKTDKKGKIVKYFKAIKHNGQISLDPEEHTDYKWVKIEDLDQYTIIKRMKSVVTVRSHCVRAAWTPFASRRM